MMQRHKLLRGGCLHLKRALHNVTGSQIVAPDHGRIDVHILLTGKVIVVSKESVVVRADFKDTAADDTGIGGVRRTSRSSLELLPLRALSRLLRALLPALTGLVLETLLGTLAGLSLLCLGTLHGSYDAAHHRSRGFRRSAGSFRRFRRLSRFFSRRCRLGCFLFYTCRTII